MTLEELRNLDWSDPGRWPGSVRYGVIGVWFVLAFLIFGYLLLWDTQQPALERVRNEEQKLRAEFHDKHGKAVNLADFEIDPDVIKLIPVEVSKKHQVIPVNRTGSSLIVAMSDPSNIYAIDDLKFLTGYNIEVVVASEVAIEEAITSEGSVRAAVSSASRA